METSRKNAKNMPAKSIRFKRIRWIAKRPEQGGANH